MKKGSLDITGPEKGQPQIIEEPADFETAIALAGFGKFNVLLIATAFASSVVGLIDSTTMAYILPLAQCDLELSNMDKGSLNAITYAGFISGSFVWGFLSDTLGRHRLLVTSMLLDGLLAFASAFSSSLWMMLLLRYLVGAMSCGALCITMSYLAEFQSARYRNAIIMINGIYLGLGQVFLPALGLGLLTQTWSVEVSSSFSLKPWNVFIMMCTTPALLGGLLISLFPETPKFLMTHGRNEEALAVFKRIYAVNTGRSPDSYPVRRLVDEVAARKASVVSKLSTERSKSVLEAARAGWSQMRPLFMMPHLPYAVLVFSIQTFCFFSSNTVRLWLPQIFTTMEEYYDWQRVSTGEESAGAQLCEMLTFQDGNQPVAATLASLLQGDGNNATLDTACVPAITSENIYTNSMIVCAAVTLSLFIATTMVNHIGYRLLIPVTAVLSGVFSLSVLWASNSAAILALLTLYLAAVNIYGNCMNGVVVAIFPTTLRTMAVSMTSTCGFIGTLLGNLVYPVMVDFGCETPFYVVTACNIGAAVLSLALPATKGKPLS